ncbi:hypothetical protein GB927_021190 [Shinella sp. CPCC 100929]|uniref:Uncharacterized protein n=1 Tax=Shinella lacus TaxID=2654216 RepID=A0ABT1RBJ6_9HYPH|nr:hypothetical protein [Shinella lacus]MCQ4632572.1 hypothetical protein [Shinella lacus]
MAQSSGTFEVEEVFTEQHDLLVLSLGFISPENPLDILHFACGRTRSGQIPPLIEDLLYIARTDQDLACDSRDLIALAATPEGIALHLTEAGAEALRLPQQTLFRFDRHPHLLPQAAALLTAMSAAGQEQVAP